MPNAAAPSFQPAAGVEYTTIDGAPGKYFTCAALRCLLRVESCARSWRDSRVEGPGKRQSCRGCPTGALHAGQPVGPTGGCVRCGPSASRMICGKHVCAGCYNRNREVLVWRNGRGQPPDIIGRKLSPGLVLLATGAGLDDSEAVHHDRQGREIKKSLLVPPFDDRAELRARPAIFRLPGARKLLWAVVSGEPELLRLCERLLPDYLVEHAEVLPSFASLHAEKLDPSSVIRQRTNAVVTRK